MADLVETVRLGPLVVPRVFNGLWQLSSPAWGTAPVSKIKQEMKRYFDAGFIAFGNAVSSSLFSSDDNNNLIQMGISADHYGSAEQIFGSFRSSLAPEDRSRVICATKWCVFRPTDPTPQFVREAVHERLAQTGAQTVDLLQVHWSDYSSRAYIVALRYLQSLQIGPNKLINALGLCNFDSARTDEICTALGPGAIVSNQVQIKLLTYGTLCGGFLSDKYLGAQLPDTYSSLTPSERKYLDIILNVWGDWPLFQQLLSTLRSIGDRHDGRSIAVIATRWVLDYPFVAAVLCFGARHELAALLLSIKTMGYLTVSFPVLLSPLSPSSSRMHTRTIVGYLASV
ncbi:hypothetical protein Clacol_008227 [Clathrus columnatus]|uniref:NADP-dependent oxidoreductase domain-containing protein n=1 Tax=Clathrus columnatus TaxID=1419009 RepID=A0AAV5AM85_9AGAM|nr:hypothetical protein Clacol_008227 [Clathrus columnatus]